MLHKEQNEIVPNIMLNLGHLFKNIHTSRKNWTRAWEHRPIYSRPILKFASRIALCKSFDVIWLLFSLHLDFRIFRESSQSLNFPKIFQKLENFEIFRLEQFLSISCRFLLLKDFESSLSNKINLSEIELWS